MMPNLHLRLAMLARAALAGLVVVSVAACGQDSPAKLMASAKERLAKGERNAAVIELKNLLAKAPDNGEARLLLGQAMFDAGDYVSAEKELARALELKQPQEKVLPPYVLSLLRQGKNEAVVSEVPKYRLFNPEAVAATQTALGDAYRQLKNSARAKEAYAVALAAVPGYPRARLGDAVILTSEGKTDEALKEIDAVIAAAPKLSEANVLRAEILLSRGDRPGARKALEGAIDSDERNLQARLALISLLISEKRFDAAGKLVDGTRKLAPAHRQLMYLDGLLAFRQGDMERARQQAEQVLKHPPENVPALVLLGTVALQERQYAVAEKNLRKASAIAPNHAGARRLLVQTYLRSGQPGKARETLQPLIEGALPTDARLLLLAGETYLANGDVKRATTFYQAAAKGGAGSDEQQAAARTRLGQVALATGRTDEGFEQLEAAANVDSGSLQADLAIIAGHLRRKELDAAMKAVQALEKKHPSNPLVFQMYGVVSLAKRDPAAARRNFEKALGLQPTYLPAAQALAMLDIHQDKVDDARRRYEAMIVREPNNEELLLALAELQVRTGAAAGDVIATLQRAIKADPRSPLARQALISFYLRAGDSKAALTAAQEALAALPSDPQVLGIAAAAQEAAGEINQAIGTYNKLASLQPQSPQPLYRLAGLYQRQKDTDKAIETLRRVQKLAPNDQDVGSQMVRVYMAGGRPEEALREARALQKREPKSARGWALEGDVHLAGSKYAEAERAYREALKRDPKSDNVAIALHLALSRAGKSSEADAWARKWTAENPKNVEMRLYLGNRELAARNLRAAAQHYQAVIGIDPENGLALNNLAWIGGELGDPKALGLAERAVRLDPNNPVFLDTYGMLLVKKGQAEKGLPLLERARRLAPARNDLRLNYAKALIKAGRKEEARKELEALQAVKGNFNGKDEVAGLLKGL